MLLYMAARAQLVQQVIRPALADGKTVISDRFLLANVVYQGYAGGLDVEKLWQVGEVAVGGLHPDLTIVLDMDVAAAQLRMNREPDRMEAQGTRVPGTRTRRLPCRVTARSRTDRPGERRPTD